MADRFLQGDDRASLLPDRALIVSETACVLRDRLAAAAAAVSCQWAQDLQAIAPDAASENADPVRLFGRQTVAPDSGLSHHRPGVDPMR